MITRYKGGKYLMYIMVAVVLLAGLSWGVASHFVSATYLASATIQARNKDRDLEIYELNEWQDYHEELLADQQFHIMAAERFRRRGLENFGEASAVGDLIRTSTHHRSTQTGELTIELSGKGAQRTELVLNTLVTSIRSYSEAAKAQRTDGATTIISSDAAVGDAPLTNTTPIYAAGLFLAAFMLTLGIAAPTWKNLSKSKREFEQQAKADEIGAQADWVEPEKLAKPIRTRIPGWRGPWGRIEYRSHGPDWRWGESFRRQRVGRLPAGYARPGSLRRRKRRWNRPRPSGPARLQQLPSYRCVFL